MRRLLGCILILGVALAENLLPFTETLKPEKLTVVEPELPAIIAETFQAHVLDVSKQSRFYMLELLESMNPQTGRIFLAKDGSDPLAAFRIVRTYGPRKIAVKKIHDYPQAPKKDMTFLGVLKISDITPTKMVKALASDEELELLELERKLNIRPDDPELDHYDHWHMAHPEPTPVPKKETLPPPAVETPKEKSSEPEKEDEEDTFNQPETIEDIKHFDPYKHWVTVGFGFVNNTTRAVSSAYFSSGNLRYGLTLRQNVFITNPQFQDSIALEVGAYFYKAANLMMSGDAYTLMAGIGTLRYTVMTSENFGIFGYAGGLTNFVVQNSLSSASASAALSSTGMALGVGFLTRIGPSWFLRADLGLDALGASIVLRF